MPDELISAEVCAKMGIPEGSKWGHNAAEIRQMQINAGMTFEKTEAGMNQSEITSGMLGTQI